MKPEELEPGIDILNTGKGHMEIRYQNNDPIEIERAKRVITDMLRRGYVLFIEGAGKKLTRVKNFDNENGVYIIADLGESAPDPVINSSLPKTAKKDVKVPVEKVRATAIARSAGG